MGIQGRELLRGRLHCPFLGLHPPHENNAVAREQPADTHGCSFNAEMAVFCDLVHQRPLGFGRGSGFIWNPNLPKLCVMGNSLESGMEDPNVNLCPVGITKAKLVSRS